MRRIILLCILALILTGTAAGQPRAISENVGILEADASITDAQVLYQSWRTLQRRAHYNITDLEFIQTIDADFDSQAGPWNTQQEFLLNGALKAGTWERELIRFESNGRITTESEWEAMSVQWNQLLGNALAEHAQDISLPLDLLKNMQPAGLAHEVMLQGHRHWRIDMRPSQANAPYERVTLWVHQENGRLSRSRAVARSPQSSFVATTDYRRTLGIDVPFRRQLKGHIQTRRRSRVRSVFFDVRSDFSNIE